MNFELPENISSLIILTYLAIALVLGIISAAALGILFKHAEKRSVASAVATAFTLLFLGVVIFSVVLLLS